MEKIKKKNPSSHYYCEIFFWLSRTAWGFITHHRPTTISHRSTHTHSDRNIEKAFMIAICLNQAFLHRNHVVSLLNSWKKSRSCCAPALSFSNRIQFCLFFLHIICACVYLHTQLCFTRSFPVTADDLLRITQPK